MPSAPLHLISWLQQFFYPLHIIIKGNITRFTRVGDSIGKKTCSSQWKRNSSCFCRVSSLSGRAGL